MTTAERLAESARLLDVARGHLDEMTPAELVQYAHAQAALVSAVIADTRARREGWLVQRT